MKAASGYKTVYVTFVCVSSQTTRCSLRKNQTPIAGEGAGGLKEKKNKKDVGKNLKFTSPAAACSFLPLFGSGRAPSDGPGKADLASGC